MFLLSAAIKCLRKLNIQFSIIKNEQKLTVVVGAFRGLHLVIRVAAVAPLSRGVTFQPLSDINQTNPYTQWRDGPIPIVTQAVQLLFSGLTVTPIPYQPVSQPPYHQRWPKRLHPTALETSSNGVVETLRPEPDQAQTIIKVVLKFLSGLMPILTNNTHITAYLGRLWKTRRNPVKRRQKNLLTEDLRESALYAYHVVIKNYLFRLRVRP